MTQKDNNLSHQFRELQQEIDPDREEGLSVASPRKEPVFTGFEEEEEDGYEEPDRDTDYASSYREENLEEDDFDDHLLDEQDDTAADDDSDWREAQPTQHWDETDAETGDDVWDEPLAAAIPGDNDSETSRTGPPDSTAGLPPILADADGRELDAAEEWDEDDFYDDEEADTLQRLPLGLIVVAIVALLLLAAGGYGVMQQRSATQAEIRELQAALAIAANPTEVTASRDALRDAEASNVELAAAVEALTLQNRQLTDTVAGLESQLEVQQLAASGETDTSPAEQPAEPALKPVAAVTPEPAAPAPATPALDIAQPITPQPATPQPSAPQPATPPSSGPGDKPWFVNFGSYSQRSAADNWAAKLQPQVGKVVVTGAEKDGRTFYRVRVVELPDKQAAEKVARALESEYGLSKLWVGKP